MSAATSTYYFVRPSISLLDAYHSMKHFIIFNYCMTWIHPHLSYVFIEWAFKKRSCSLNVVLISVVYRQTGRKRSIMYSPCFHIRPASFTWAMSGSTQSRMLLRISTGKHLPFLICIEKQLFPYESTRSSDREMGGLLKFSGSKILRKLLHHSPSVSISNF